MPSSDEEGQDKRHLRTMIQKMVHEVFTTKLLKSIRPTQPQEGMSRQMGEIRAGDSELAGRESQEVGSGI